MQNQLISRVRVEGLFGLYNYEIPAEREIGKTVILYGDNGVGKTSVLNLVFHLMSAAGDRGHRSALYRSNFNTLEVELASGALLTAEFYKRSDVKVLRLEISERSKLVARWDYFPGERSKVRSTKDGTTMVLYVSDDGQSIVQQLDDVVPDDLPEGVIDGEVGYLTSLRKRVPASYLLGADRRLESDSVSDPGDELELRRMLTNREPKRVYELLARTREIALSQALNAAASWIRRKAVAGANQGSMNVHAVYTDILRRLISTASGGGAPTDPQQAAKLKQRFSQIEATTALHARYELATPLLTTDFQKALSENSSSKLAFEFLSPYAESLEGRLAAVQPIHELIDRFTSIANALLRDKVLSFKLSDGFILTNRLGASLTPAQLSSGEQQLLLLFCYVLVSREQPSVFIIDEPELSLNIKWQRQLIESLNQITDGADIQFIFASHSIELIAQHTDYVVRMG